MTMFRTLCLTLALLMGMATVASAQAEDSPAATAAQTDKILLMLSGYEYFPTRADLEAVTPSAPDVLIAISKNTDLKPSLRVRAIDALGLFDGEARAATHFEAVLAAGNLDEVYLRHSMTSSLKAFGPAALPWVQPYLGHGDSVIRLDAAHAMQRFGGEDAREMLRLRKDVESDPFVRDQLTKLVSQGVGR